MSDIICPICKSKFKTAQSLATHKRRYHPIEQNQLHQVHQNIKDTSSHDDISSDDSSATKKTQKPEEPSSEQSVAESMDDTKKETDSAPIISGTCPLKSDCPWKLNDGTGICRHPKSEIISTKRKIAQSFENKLHKKSKRRLRSKNRSSDDINVTEVLHSIKHTLDKISSTVKNINLATKAPWNFLDAFDFKRNLFPYLETCSQQNFSKSLKDVLTEKQMTFLEAAKSETSLNDLTILLNENNDLFLEILERFKDCNVK